ncbi:hypothetical protein [Stenotrophomonas sp. PS02298]|uniref:hypothetical protein n=1 Tax=Stenotrophomonas sp. PS02298 TaxID=2991424 RepID=UPI00249B0D1D|nr:hypothetical protein [Stenotrophomonas sp. PS02298]
MTAIASRACGMIGIRVLELGDVLPKLQASGCFPLEVNLSERRVCIVIAPPSDGCFIQGVMCRRETIAGVTKRVYVAPFHGCLLKWEQAHETDYRQAAQR